MNVQLHGPNAKCTAHELMAINIRWLCREGNSYVSDLPSIANAQVQVMLRRKRDRLLDIRNVRGVDGVYWDTALIAYSTRFSTEGTLSNSLVREQLILEVD